MIKPKNLMQGSTIAISSPSNGLPHLFPEIYELGLKNLKDVLGFDIIELPTSRMSSDELYKNPKLRADDINTCFKEESINGLITSIGGYESIRILPYLDTETILNHPKFIMGFSDATTFLSYLNQLGLVTFYGPSVMAGLAQIRSLPYEYTEHLKSVLFSNQFPYRYSPYGKWTNGYRDWSDKDALGECQEFYENKEGWAFLQGTSVVQGYLWGGCIEVLEFMKSTVYWPSEAFWNDKILFFETSEEKPSPMQVGYILRNYGMQGIFSQIKGIIFGRAKDYTSEEKLKLNEIVLKVVNDEFGAENVLIVVDFDFGHTDPKLILPLGTKVELNPKTKEITLMENPFEI